MSNFLPENPLNILTSFSPFWKGIFFEILYLEALEADLVLVNSSLSIYNYTIDSALPNTITTTLFKKKSIFIRELSHFKILLDITVDSDTNSITRSIDQLINPAYCKEIFKPINKDTYNMFQNTTFLTSLVFQELGRSYTEYVKRFEYPVFVG